MLVGSGCQLNQRGEGEVNGRGSRVSHDVTKRIESYAHTRPHNNFRYGAGIYGAGDL